MPAVDIEEIELTSIDETDADWARARRRHLFMLRLSIGVIICAFLLRSSGDTLQSKVFPDLPMPTMCGSRALFDVECPGCGLTRSFVALAEGDLAHSIAMHRVGWVLALAVLLQIPYRLFALWDKNRMLGGHTWPDWFGRALIALLIGNWLGGILGLF